MFTIELVENEAESTVSKERIAAAKQVVSELSRDAALNKKPFDALAVSIKLLTMTDADFNKIAKLCGVTK